MRGKQLAGRRGVRVDLGEVPVALPVVVVGVDDHLTGQRLDRYLAVAAERDRHHHQVGYGTGFRRGGRTGVRAERFDETGQGLGSAGVAQHRAVAGVDRQPGQRAADVPAADESK